MIYFMALLQSLVYVRLRTNELNLCSMPSGAKMFFLAPPVGPGLVEIHEFSGNPADGLLGRER